jgi:hypothetical protein
MIELLKRIFAGQNQFASGGLLLMLVGGVSVYLRAVPMRIWVWLVDQSTMSITIKGRRCRISMVKRMVSGAAFSEAHSQLGCRYHAARSERSPDPCAWVSLVLAFWTSVSRGLLPKRGE